MMINTASQIQQFGSAPSTGSFSTEKKTANISADFETFLKMLTVQMRNQDPLNPVDSSDYATQLATFSGVEQQVQTNTLLRQLAGVLGAGGLAQLAEWVGMEARAAMPALFDGAPITVITQVDKGSDAAELVVTDDKGAVVQRLPLPTDNLPVVWAGVTSDGTPFPRGYYRFDTVRIASGQVTGERPAEVFATVTEVQIKDGVNTLVLKGGKTIAASAVTAVRNPDL